MEQEIQKRYDQLRTFLTRIQDPSDEMSPDEDVIKAVTSREADVAERASSVLREDSYQDFLLSFVQRERERFLAETPDEHDYGDEVRSEPLCTCSDAFCDLKQGKLPVVVRRAEDLDVGIRKFKQAHHGYPRVLDEAQEARDAKLSGIVADLGKLIVALSKNIPPDELPESRSPDQPIPA